MAMYGNFVATSMGKGQLVKENHVFFSGEYGNSWQHMGYITGFMGSNQTWAAPSYHRKFINRDQYYESQWEGLSRLSHILWKITNDPNHQPVIELPDGLAVTSHIDHNLCFHIPQFQRTIIFHSHQAASKSILNFPATTFQIASYHSR